MSCFCGPSLVWKMLVAEDGAAQEEDKALVVGTAAVSMSTQNIHVVNPLTLAIPQEML